MRQKGRRERIRLVDVAVRAGVSKSIASRVLNDRDGLAIRPETRTRVLDAARELDYRPHAAARALKSAETGALGLVIPNLTNPIFALISRGSVRRALERDFAVLITEDLAADEADEIVAGLVRAGRIDGVIVASAYEGHPLVDRLRKLRIPHVFMLRAIPNSRRNVVPPDEEASALAVGHLAELGHVAVAHVAGPRVFSSSRRLAKGFRRGAGEHGLRRPLVVECEFSERGGAEAAHVFLSQPRRPTGITTASAGQALGALHAAWGLGLRVPDDVSIVACGDTPILEFLAPPLTAIQLPYAELGALAVDALVGQLLGERPRDVSVDSRPELVRRGSTGQPPSLVGAGDRRESPASGAVAAE
jgi:DNA-binding LacI/PurR family transcriptional regulator